MAHKITYPITLDNNITINSMHCYPVPIFNNLSIGKIAFDLRFYKDRYSRNNGHARIYPMHNGDIISSFVKQLDMETLMNPSGMTTSLFNKYIDVYLENIYGFWNIYEEDYEYIDIVNITETTLYEPLLILDTNPTLTKILITGNDTNLIIQHLGEELLNVNATNTTQEYTINKQITDNITFVTSDSVNMKFKMSIM